jgi:hypothetical protein
MPGCGVKTASRRLMASLSPTTRVPWHIKQPPRPPLPLSQLHVNKYKQSGFAFNKYRMCPRLNLLTGYLVLENERCTVDIL